MSNTDTGDTGTISAVDNHPSIIAGGQIAPRESIISTAITFLQNSNVKRSPLNQKQKFLRSKGLTEDEIQIACERAGVFTIDPNSTVINIGTTTGNVPMYPVQQQLKVSTFQRIKDIVGTTAFVAGITYAIYLFYKNYIEPLLFGRKKKKKTVEDTIEELKTSVHKSMDDLSREMERVREEISYKTRNESVYKELSNFKSDLDAIKGLLLNRKQFASPVVPPSIPVWQLQSQHTHRGVPDETEPDKNDDAGSGSGSSETEVVTKNSDSSLELIS